MGLFSRNKPAVADRAAGPTAVVRPIVVQPADLPAFSARLETVLRAIGGTDAQLRGAIAVLSESVGGFDPFGQESLRFMRQGPESIKAEIKRPWRWFVKASELAHGSGDHLLPLRIFMFTAWFKSMQSKLGTPDFADMRLDPVPQDSYHAIWSTAAEALDYFSGDDVVARTADEVITVDLIRTLVERDVAG